MKDKFAKTLSLVYHPLFMPTFGILILFGFDNFYGFFPSPYKWFIFLVIWVFTLLMPLITFWVLKKTNQITSYQMHNKQERIVPMILTLSCYLAAYVLLYRFKVPQVISRFILGGIITLFIAGLITPFWKISAHMAGIGSFAGAFFMLSLVLNQNLSALFSLIVFMGGFLGWSRLHLKAHTMLQVGAGYLLGFVIMILVFYQIA